MALNRGRLEVASLPDCFQGASMSRPAFCHLQVTDKDSKQQEAKLGGEGDGT